jgi:hypothetical protein
MTEKSVEKLLILEIFEFSKNKLSRISANVLMITKDESVINTDLKNIFFPKNKKNIFFI